jgi:hypothetical protein
VLNAVHDVPSVDVQTRGVKPSTSDATTTAEPARAARPGDSAGAVMSVTMSLATKPPSAELHATSPNPSVPCTTSRRPLPPSSATAPSPSSPSSRRCQCSDTGAAVDTDAVVVSPAAVDDGGVETARGIELVASVSVLIVVDRVSRAGSEAHAPANDNETSTTTAAPRSSGVFREPRPASPNAIHHHFYSRTGERTTTDVHARRVRAALLGRS